MNSVGLHYSLFLACFTKIDTSKVNRLDSATGLKIACDGLNSRSRASIGGTDTEWRNRRQQSRLGIYLQTKGGPFRSPTMPPTAPAGPLTATPALSDQMLAAPLTVVGLGQENPFRYFNSSPEVIRLVVMMYVRYPLSLRNVEDLLAERGIDISHETVRFWWNRFGPMFAAEIRKKRVAHMRGYPQWRWHLDEGL